MATDKKDEPLLRLLVEETFDIRDGEKPFPLVNKKTGDSYHVVRTITIPYKSS